MSLLLSVKGGHRIPRVTRKKRLMPLPPLTLLSSLPAPRPPQEEGVIEVGVKPRWAELHCPADLLCISTDTELELSHH